MNDPRETGAIVVIWTCPISGCDFRINRWYPASGRTVSDLDLVETDCRTIGKRGSAHARERHG